MPLCWWGLEVAQAWGPGEGAEGRRPPAQLVLPHNAQAGSMPAHWIIRPRGREVSRSPLREEGSQRLTYCPGSHSQCPALPGPPLPRGKPRGWTGRRPLPPQTGLCLGPRQGHRREGDGHAAEKAAVSDTALPRGSRQEQVLGGGEETPHFASLAFCPLQPPRTAWPSSEKGDPAANYTHLLGSQGGAAPKRAGPKPQGLLSETYPRRLPAPRATSPGTASPAGTQGLLPWFPLLRQRRP